MGLRPKYGYGKYGRPLESEQERDGEEVRKVLRSAGFREFNGERAQRGFAVNGNREVILVSHADDGDEAEWLTRYADVLRRRGGWEVVQDLVDELVLAVWRRPRH